MATAEVVSELCRPPLFTIDEATAAGGVPSDSGFYAWWQTPGAIPVVPARRPGAFGERVEV